MPAAPDSPQGAAPAAAQDLKARMKEALERKQRGGTPHPGQVAADGKVHGAHGAESHRKEFRRKSG